MTTLTELRALALAATPGPWVSKWYEGDDFPMIKLSNDTINDITRREDADYIAALSPERVLQLLDVIEAAKALRDAGVSIGQRVVLPDAEPDSMADDTALGEFIGIFDGPLQREFDAAIDAAKEKP